MIEASPTAPEGSVTSPLTYVPSDFPSDAAILCRNTAPLVSFAFSLIRRGVGCRVLGREIGQGLVTLVKKLNTISIDDLEKRLEMYESREVSKFEAKGEDAAADAIRDRCYCIFCFMQNLSEDRRTIDELCRKITSLFDDSASGLLTLSTVHKAKGLEWPTVFILDFSKYMPSKYARLPWQVTQEHNLIYVAVTRAKLHLKYIESNSWRDPKASRKLTAAQQLTQQD